MERKRIFTKYRTPVPEKAKKFLRKLRSLATLAAAHVRLLSQVLRVKGQGHSLLRSPPGCCVKLKHFKLPALHLC